MTGESPSADPLTRAHDELRALLKEYQRLGATEIGGERALQLLIRIREVGEKIRALRHR